jgi:tetratricopeptide (TPR) repeat protein
MVKFFRVKEKARGLARQQKYDLALAEYRAAIAAAEKEHDAAALRNLYNAAGDAALQKNDMPMAVEYFFKAADSYVDEGLFDNAIAICHKILRNVPTKAEAYARLGTIYAEKGLRQQALQHWLEFAERREKAGDVAGVTRALREVIALSPESDTVRAQLAEILLSQGERADALAELQELRRRAQEAGESGRVSELERRIRDLRGELGLGAEDELSAAAREQATSGRGAPEFPGGGNGDRAGGEPGELVMERFEPLEGLAPAQRDEAVPTVGGVSGLDSGFGFSSREPGLAPPGEGSPESGPQPQAEPPPEAASREAGAAEPSVGSLPGLTPPMPGEVGGPPADMASAPVSIPSIEDAPRPDISPIAYVPVEQRLARAEARLEEDPTDAEERIYLGELYQEAGDMARARSAMELGARELFQAGQHERAYRAFQRLATLASDDVEAVQKLVEVAQAIGTKDYLISSYELLADRLMEAEQYGRAAEIHRQILAIEPDRGHSQDQLLILEGLDAPPAAAGVAGGGTAPSGIDEGFVDLGALIAEGATEPPQIVARARAEGPEQSELAGIIETVRKGVTEDIGEGDFDSHYDLGVAFREMGLLDQAIREFQRAARGTKHRERSFELMGLCFLEKGMTSVAANCFRRGIESEHDPHEAMGLHYHLGRSLEELGDVRGARAEYERVVALDVQFLDAAERLKNLP